MGPQQKREDPDWVKAAGQAHVYYSVPGMDAVRVRRNLSFKSRSGGPLEFDLYSATRARAPAVILIHGGPIPANVMTPPKEWGIFQSLGRLLGASGLSAVMFNHRFFTVEKAPEALSDIQDLIAHVSAESDSLGVDAARLCLWVFSGGGVFLGPFLADTPDAVRCIVAYYAVLRAGTAQFSAADQIAQNRGNIPPILIARAGLDLPQLNEGIDHFIQQALRKNVEMEALNHARGQHGFDGRDDTPRTREILRRTVEFIRTHLNQGD